jgi:uncharacterized membrane protein YqjE
VAISSIRMEPDAKITDLISRLTDDSKRLVTDEARLAKLEAAEGLRTGMRGALWLMMSFALGTVALVALTILVAAAIGRAVGYHYYAGALIVGALEIGIGYWLLHSGVQRLKEPSYTLEHSREQLKETANWATNPTSR